MNDQPRLRRKLLVLLGSLIMLLAVVLVISVWLLQQVMDDVQHVSKEAMVLVDQASQLNTSIATVEAELYRLQLGQSRHLDALIDVVEQLRGLTDELGQHYLVQEGPARSTFAGIEENLPNFLRHVGALATTRDPELAAEHNVEALRASIALRYDVNMLTELARQHAQNEQQTLVSHFRTVVFGLATAFLAILNISIIVLLRASSLVVKPVEQLVEASRQLAAGRLDYRVQLKQQDEFDELADALNHLAAQLQADEQRRIEVLQQVALTLNHELNNALAIIELQLRLLRKHAEENEPFNKRLQQIHESLHRMASTLEALKHVRRIVLTDYTERGAKMLDISRSIQPDEEEQLAVEEFADEPQS